MFILEFAIKESLWNIMPETYKNRDAKKKQVSKILPDLSEMSGN